MGAGTPRCLAARSRRQVAQIVKSIYPAHKLLHLATVGLTKPLISLETAFETHRAAIDRFVRARLGFDQADADDIMQDIWLKASATAAGPVIDQQSYLFRLANNAVLERHRSLSRTRRRDTVWLHDVSATESSAGPHSVEDALLARQRLALVERALAGAGERAARMLRRYRIDGIGQRQIAEEFGVSLSTVEKDLRRAYDALAALKRQLDEE